MDLDRLPDAQSVAEIVHRSFKPFSSETCVLSGANGNDPLSDPHDGLHLVYLYGHAWIDDDHLTTAISVNGSSVHKSMLILLENLLIDVSQNNLILILDCCHAEAAAPITSSSKSLLTVFGCARAEKAISLTNENASRLSLSFELMLSNAKDQADLNQVIGQVAQYLDIDGVIRGQSVSFESNGEPVVLTRNHASQRPKRSQTVSRVRNRLIAGGGVIVAILTGLGWFLWNHTLIQVDVADLATIATDIRVVGISEKPSQNESSTFSEKKITGRRVRLWVPAGNTILRVKATYTDGNDRALSLHVLIKPSFDVFKKLLTWELPSAEQIKTHPNMAYVPATQWIRGRDRELQKNDTPYWIDIRPPTVSEYVEIAKKLLQSGEIEMEESFILTARQNSAAVDATGLDQLRTLSSDLGDIFGVLQAGNSEEVAAPGDLAIGLGELACDDCPAPMKHREAILYCSSRGMELPTDAQWELAVRGIDGRTFPWGDQFDHSKGNVPGLPDKGDPPATLKPVLQYQTELSPFGLFDTVGNAGDWVINTQGAYETVYMGATYRYNPEDATAFRMLPMTEETSLVREITARCVVR